MNNRKYYIGLDIGTNSIGFCATDENYNIIKKSGKSLAGVKLFEEGQTALDRRVTRASRRRLARRKQRILLLQELFAGEINKKDAEFFIRLQDSMYHIEDKVTSQKNTLFNDSDFKDKDFHKKYKTVYHLRHALMNDDITDPRLLYLGIEHIMKTRGHFLFYGDDMSSISSFDKVYQSVEEVFDGRFDSINIHINDHLQAFEGILTDKKTSPTAKEKSIKQLMTTKATKEQTAFIKLILGLVCNLTDLFGAENLADELVESKKKITFKGNFDETFAEISSLLDDDMKLIIEYSKAIYDYVLLQEILFSGDNAASCISDAQIYKYDLHKQELKTLKEMIKQYQPNSYNDIFKNNDVSHNYVSYVGLGKKNGNKAVVKNKICSQEDFCKYVLKELSKNDVEITNPKHLEMMEKLKNNNVLPKQRNSKNGVIPHQIHLAELKIILEKASKTFSFLNETDDDNLTVSDKIISIFKFRVPYYVGPLNSHSSHAWIVKRNENVKIRPWNFESVVNIEDSAEAFIRRMTNKCTYLGAIGEDVVPKKSLIYSKYMVLNELNNLKINGQPITVELKQNIFNNLFMKEKSVSQHKLKQFLKKECNFDNGDIVFTGIDGDFKSSLESFIVFKNIFGENYDYHMAENIIKWNVLFSDDKSLLKKKIKDNYKNITDDQLHRIANYKCVGWGSLSKAFLQNIICPDTQTGEAISILDMLYITNLNLMQILSKDYGYIAEINKLLSHVDNSTITSDTIKDLYCSPAVKKSIWLTVQIVQEIEKIMKCSPAKLFIETTRAEGDKVRTRSRKNDLMDKYKFIKKEYGEIYNQLDGKTDMDLRQKKLYLYFTQLGRCAYTNKAIDIENLNNHNIYDIEHIYPRSLTKDDSIHNNLVLVCKEANQEMSNIFPKYDKYRQEALWSLLYQKNLITKTKFDRLNRNTPFESGELEGFIARQLVETSQTSKAVATLFGQYYNDKDSKVVYVKAGNVSDFRKHFNITKIRDLNDYHHAHDAFLNIVVGNVWDTRFTQNFFKQINTKNYSIKPEVLYNHNSKGNVESAWNEHSIGSIKKQIENTRFLFTRKPYKATGALFDATIYKKVTQQDSKYFSIKNTDDVNSQEYKLSDITKYGYYNKIYGSHFSVVEHTVKEERVRTIEFVPIYLTISKNYNDDTVLDYFTNFLKLVEPKIILKELKIDSLLKVNGMPVHLSGRSNDDILCKSAVQLNVTSKEIEYIKKINKFATRYTDNSELTITKNDNITKEENVAIYDMFKSKLKTQHIKYF